MLGWNCWGGPTCSPRQVARPPWAVTQDCPYGINGMKLDILDLGLIDYEPAWKLQDEYAAEIAAGTRPPTLLLLEHPHTFTFGRKGHTEILLWSPE